MTALWTSAQHSRSTLMDSVRHHHARAFLWGKLATSLDEVPEVDAARLKAPCGSVRDLDMSDRWVTSRDDMRSR